MQWPPSSATPLLRSFETTDAESITPSVGNLLTVKTRRRELGRELGVEL